MNKVTVMFEIFTCISEIITNLKAVKQPLCTVLAVPALNQSRK